MSFYFSHQLVIYDLWPSSCLTQTLVVAHLGLLINSELHQFTRILCIPLKKGNLNYILVGYFGSLAALQNTFSNSPFPISIDLFIILIFSVVSWEKSNGSLFGWGRYLSNIIIYYQSYSHNRNHKHNHNHNNDMLSIVLPSVILHVWMHAWHLFKILLKYRKKTDECEIRKLNYDQYIMEH